MAACNLAFQSHIDFFALSSKLEMELNKTSYSFSIVKVPQIKFFKTCTHRLWLHYSCCRISVNRFNGFIYLHCMPTKDSFSYSAGLGMNTCLWERRKSLYFMKRKTCPWFPRRKTLTLLFYCVFPLKSIFPYVFVLFCFYYIELIHNISKFDLVITYNKIKIASEENY